MILKADPERRNNALSHGMTLIRLSHVPVNDFALSILSILFGKISVKISEIMRNL